jgi:hypothetical protein
MEKPNGKTVGCAFVVFYGAFFVPLCLDIVFLDNANNFIFKVKSIDL